MRLAHTSARLLKKFPPFPWRMHTHKETSHAIRYFFFPLLKKPHEICCYTKYALRGESKLFFLKLTKPDEFAVSNQIPETNPPPSKGSKYQMRSIYTRRQMGSQLIIGGCV